MGTETRAAALRAHRKSAGGDTSGRHIRASWSLPIFAAVVTTALIVTNAISPEPAVASTVVAPREMGSQELVVAGEYSNAPSRDAFSTSEVYVAPPPSAAPVAPAAGVPDPGTAQAIAWARIQSIGWGQEQFDCLVALWNKESGWNVYAHNVGSGAYGIPQALPGDKMASVGADWATNPATQIEWGIIYIINTYDNPCGAWQFSEAKGYY